MIKYGLKLFRLKFVHFFAVIVFEAEARKGDLSMNV